MYFYIIKLSKPLNNVKRGFCLRSRRLLLISSIISVLVSCKKIVEIDNPINSITTLETFSSDVLATSAVLSIYNNMVNKSTPKFGNGSITLYTGLSSDELKYFYGTNATLTQFQSNALISNNNSIYSDIWASAYFTIYQANASIEGIQSSSAVTKQTGDQLIAESKFLRAFCYFYLINIFGDVPLVLTSDWRQTNLLTRTPASEVYQQIINDLKDIQDKLPLDYAISNNERVRATRWAVTALLARSYLYTFDWSRAEKEATKIIENTNLYELASNLSDVFKKNNKENILQLQVSSTIYPFAVKEANEMVPFNRASNPFYFFTDQLLNSFVTSDLRRKAWIDSTIYQGKIYYYPYKYKIAFGSSGNITEYYTLFRLAEQYLIRAEAMANQNNLNGAIKDLNVLRSRAGLPNLSSSLTQSELISAVEEERKHEMFSEWGHRWLDLKRWGKADNVLGQIKGVNWQTTDQWYPIPLLELQANPNLTQNDAY
jgi:starch-binding outer membrane protein, SusD/RagB family